MRLGFSFSLGRGITCAVSVAVTVTASAPTSGLLGYRFLLCLFLLRYSLTPEFIGARPATTSCIFDEKLM